MQHTLYQIGVLSDPCCFSSGSEQLSRQGLLSSSGMPQNIQEGLLSSSGTPQILLENLTSVLYITYNICNIDISVLNLVWFQTSVVSWSHVVLACPFYRWDHLYGRSFQRSKILTFFCCEIRLQDPPPILTSGGFDDKNRINAFLDSWWQKCLNYHFWEWMITFWENVQ